MANPISRTAYYTLAVRAADAATRRPLCGDTFAHHFMNDEAHRVWDEFKGFHAANVSNAARHRLIDDHLRRVLAADADATIVVIGAGFDTRAFRLTGGRWFEFDEPEILTYKERRLPAATAPNALRRVAVDFSRDALADKLLVIGEASKVHLVVEGVLMYLTREQKAGLARTLATRFAHHRLYCDLMRKTFFERYGRAIHERILGLGATFTDVVDQPAGLFLEAGYDLVESASIAVAAAAGRGSWAAAWIVRQFMPAVRDGYQIAVFRR